MNDVGQMDNNTLRHAFEVGVLNRCLSNHGKKHWETVKMILKYLSDPKDKHLCLGNTNYMDFKTRL